MRNVKRLNRQPLIPVFGHPREMVGIVRRSSHLERILHPRIHLSSFPRNFTKMCFLCQSPKGQAQKNRGKQTWIDLVENPPIEICPFYQPN